MQHLRSRVNFQIRYELTEKPLLTVSFTLDNVNTILVRLNSHSNSDLSQSNCTKTLATICLPKANTLN